MKYMNLGQLYAMEPPSAQSMRAETNKSLQCYTKGVELLRHKLSQQQQQQAQIDKLKQELAMAYCTIAELFMTDLCDVPDAEHRCHEALQCADEVAPNDPHVLQDWASFLITTHKNELAMVKLEQVVSQIMSCDPSLVMQSFPYDFQIATCRMLIELEKHDVAKQLLTNMLHHFDQCADVWYMLGHVILATSKNEDMYKKHLLKAMTLAKGDMFEVEIREELQEKFGKDVLTGVNLHRIDEELDAAYDEVEDGGGGAGGGGDEEDWEDVDTDSDEEM